MRLDWVIWPLFLAVSLPSLSQGRIVSRCELKTSLEKAMVLPEGLEKFRKIITTVAICEVEKMSKRNTTLIRTTSNPQLNPELATTAAMRPPESNTTAPSVSINITSPTQPTMANATGPPESLITNTTRPFNLTISNTTRPPEPTNTTSPTQPTITNATEPTITNSTIPTEPTITNATSPSEPTITNVTEPTITNTTSPTEPIITNATEPTEPTIPNTTSSTEPPSPIEPNFVEADSPLIAQQVEMEALMNHVNGLWGTEELARGGDLRRPRRDLTASSRSYYGVFQLSDADFCFYTNPWTYNFCITSCTAFIDDDITDDVECFVNSHHWIRLIRGASRECLQVTNFFEQCK
ncbi:uncharacterized protein LOC144198767 [Stigmatopora nigra]